ncbi:MAG TPA: hypothetical protein VFD97_03885 [Acidimicrobiia bacterium]|nr:hypothetical protein [Acidimicrobiia bacterium]
MYRHRFDTVSFIFGLLFVAAATLAPLREHLPADVGLWLVPGALVLLGVGIAVSAIATNRSDEV